jgi:hypothetical protein
MPVEHKAKSFPNKDSNLRFDALTFPLIFQMKTFVLALFLFVTGASAAEIQVFFSPNGGCTEAVVENLKNASNTVFVQAYSFTSALLRHSLMLTSAM